MENITQWHLTFVGLENLWLRVLVLFLAITAVYFSWHGVKTISTPGKRLLLFALRFLATAIIVLLLLQPHMEQQDVLKLKNKVVYLLDNSKSMTLKGGILVSPDPSLSIISSQTTYLLQKNCKIILMSITYPFQILSKRFLIVISKRALSPMAQIPTSPGYSNSLRSVMKVNPLRDT